VERLKVEGRGVCFLLGYFFRKKQPVKSPPLWHYLIWMAIFLGLIVFVIIGGRAKPN
jgi:hypothetical protein